jgi:hypothetical protein
VTVSFGYSNFHCFVGFHLKGPSDDSTCFFGLEPYRLFYCNSIDLVQCFIDTGKMDCFDTKVVNQKHCIGYLALSYIICVINPALLLHTIILRYVPPKFKTGFVALFAKSRDSKLLTFRSELFVASSCDL